MGENSVQNQYFPLCLMASLSDVVLVILDLCMFFLYIANDRSLNKVKGLTADNASLGSIVHNYACVNSSDVRIVGCYSCPISK